MNGLKKEENEEEEGKVKVFENMWEGEEGWKCIDNGEFIEIGEEIEEGGNKDGIGRDIGRVEKDEVGKREEERILKLVWSKEIEIGGKIVKKGGMEGEEIDELNRVKEEGEKKRFIKKLVEMKVEVRMFLWEKELKEVEKNERMLEGLE